MSNEQCVRSTAVGLDRHGKSRKRHTWHTIKEKENKEQKRDKREDRAKSRTKKRE